MSILTTSTATRDQVESLVRSILQKHLVNGAVASTNGRATAASDRPNLVVNISARHCHLTQAAVDVLFGAGYQLTSMRRLYQDTDFAANETVAVPSALAAEPSSPWLCPSPWECMWRSSARSTGSP